MGKHTRVNLATTPKVRNEVLAKMGTWKQPTQRFSGLRSLTRKPGRQASIGQRAKQGAYVGA